MFRKADTMNKLYKVVLNKPIIQWVDSVALEANLDNNYYLPKYLETREHLWNSGLEIKTLSTLVNNEGFVTGSTPDYKEKEIKDGAVLLKTVNIERNELNTSKLFYISKENHGKLKKSQLNKGDLVITVIGATDEVIGRAIVYDGRFKNANITQSLAKFRVREQFDEYFVSTFLNSKYGHNLILQMSSSSTRRYVNNTELGQILVPIPSNEIQKYIGNKVRKAEELREEAKRLKEEAEKLLTQFLKLDSLEQKINKVLHLKANYVLPHDMNDRLDSEHYKKKFTILYEHLKELEQSKVKVLSLKKIIEEGSYGILPDSQDYGKGELIFIRSTDLNGYMIDLDSCETVPDKYLTPKATVSPGDILLEIKGAIAGGAIVPDIKTNAIVNGSIFRFRVKNDFNNFYILSVLQSIIGSLQKEQHGANSVISYLSLDVINNLKIPVIDIEKQNEIGDKLKKFVENNMKAKNLIKSAKQDVEDLIEGKFDESKISEGV
ncbi:hypothetical protein AVP43_02354 [Geobacillus stearothermophilus]|nr:hypothetical protein AVP43_02354 [Geobacillus stearothermophilus]